MGQIAQSHLRKEHEDPIRFDIRHYRGIKIEAYRERVLNFVNDVQDTFMMIRKPGMIFV